MTVKLIFPLMLALLLVGCMTDGPSPQKIAAAKAECNGTTTSCVIAAVSR
jgi:hypothetical protein